MTAEHLPNLTGAILEQAFGNDQRVRTHDRTLVIVSLAGLSNRIRALTSGLAVAEAAGREFAMLWPPSVACGAQFDELFQNRWRVVDYPIRPADMRLLRVSTWSERQLRQLLADQRQHIVLGYWDWLVKVRDGSSHDPLQQRCLQLVNELQPAAPPAAVVLHC